jgi:pyrimidine operon attenuation protein/uracil phosphoribosyltransferase
VTPRPPPPDSDLLERREILDEAGVARTLRRMALEIAERIPPGERPLYFVGIRTGGAFLAQRLRDLVAAAGEGSPLLGAVDITLYRDDVFRGLPKPEIGPTDLPEPVDGKTIVLVDDVLFTGRTVRAAIDALFDYGRPQRVQLAVLVDRGHRELPIRPDYVGKNMPTSHSERVYVRVEELDDVDEVTIASSVEASR